MDNVHTCDLLIAGSGAAGLATAVSAATLGLDVLVVEKAAFFGGTTCRSAGVVWVPGSRQAEAAGKRDSAAAALTYLEAEAGDRLDRERAAVFLEHAADVLAWFQENTHLRFALAPGWPDYHPTKPGGFAGGRSLGPVPFDGRSLGARFLELQPPLATTTIFGGMMVGREDVPQFYSMTRSWRAALHVANLLARYARDRMRWPRGTRLSNGSALIGMLARTAFERDVRLWLKSPIAGLVVEQDRVVGASVSTPDGPRTIRARLGVVLATGGFPSSALLRAKHYPHVAAGQLHQTAAIAECTGDALTIAQRAGAAVVENPHQPAAWTPMSIVPGGPGARAGTPYPHFLDRGKAGYLAVDRRGRRFISEARSYHDFVIAMLDACRGDGEASAWLVCDAEAIRGYGLGRAPPSPGRLQPFVQSGYLQRATSLAELARRCHIDPAGLEATVARYNEGAARGIDPEFNKGGDVYERFNGSAGVQPNPCVAPVRTAPFYAVKLVAGDIGTFVGLKTDTRSRVLDVSGRPIEGLFATGNDASSLMGGCYPAAGITLGPALVFGHLVAREAAARSASEPAIAHG
jgi:succinate dehydrogenase/fumarate reductase flavoprotein subunit